MTKKLILALPAGNSYKGFAITKNEVLWVITTGRRAPTKRVGDGPEEPRSIQARVAGRRTAVLEIGIGSGFNLLSYGLYVEKVYGVDPSTELSRVPAIVAGPREISEIGGRFRREIAVCQRCA